jgi:hypothetical protein
MIEAETVPITNALLNSEESEVREQAARLIGSFALSAMGR